jgi:MFS family permease
VAGIGRVSEPWHVHAAFLVMGLGWACLSTTAITTTLAPWFERHQGRAVSTALMGASIGGMIGVPALLFGIEWLGFPSAMLAAGAAALVTVLPLALFVMRRRPQDMGLLPDGEPPRESVARIAVPGFTRVGALRTTALRSVIVTFGLGLMIQIGFLTHHVALVAPSLGAAGASATVSATALMAFLGRLALARFADRIDVRLTTGAVLLLAAAVLSALALFPVPAVLVGASAVYGLTVGNVTTLSPIIVRREFGAAAFGAVYGAAATGIQLISALGPTFFGVLRDAFGGYGPPLLIAAALDAVAAAVVMLGGRTPPAVATGTPGPLTSRAEAG